MHRWRRRANAPHVAATGLLAENFNDAATTVNSAIGAYPEFGKEPNWNLSVKEWSDLIQTHGKITSNLKVLVNTEVYAQSSNEYAASVVRNASR